MSLEATHCTCNAVHQNASRRNAIIDRFETPVEVLPNVNIGGIGNVHFGVREGAGESRREVHGERQDALDAETNQQLPETNTRETEKNTTEAVTTT